MLRLIVVDAGFTFLNVLSSDNVQDPVPLNCVASNMLFYKGVGRIKFLSTTVD